MNDPYFPLIHHLMGVMDSFYHVPYTTTFLCRRSISCCNFHVSWSCETWLFVLEWLHSVRSVWYDSTITLGVHCLSLLRSNLTKWFFLCEPTNSSLSWSILAMTTQDKPTASSSSPQMAPIVRTWKSNSPSPLRTIDWYGSILAQINKFVTEGLKQ